MSVTARTILYDNPLLFKDIWDKWTEGHSTSCFSTRDPRSRIARIENSRVIVLMSIF
ncbi:hypothetical protein DSECCO2_269310 [anaerobic digester metagenome]